LFCFIKIDSKSYFIPFVISSVIYKLFVNFSQAFKILQIMYILMFLNLIWYFICLCLICNLSDIYITNDIRIKVIDQRIRDLVSKNEYYLQNGFCTHSYYPQLS